MSEPAEPLAARPLTDPHPDRLSPDHPDYEEIVRAHAAALEAGADGLDAVRTILRDAAAHMSPEAVLIVEVGNSEQALQRAFPRMPFTWLAFERGGGGVFWLTRDQLLSGRKEQRARRRGARAQG